MTQTHTDLSYLDFWKHLDKDAIVIVTLLLIIIASNNRHEQVAPKLLWCETKFSSQSLYFSERRTDSTHLLQLK